MAIGFAADGWTVSGCGTDTAAIQSLASELGCWKNRRMLRSILPESGIAMDHPEWEWAELDRKRLVWVTKGVLNAARIHGKGLGDVKEFLAWGVEFSQL